MHKGRVRDEETRNFKRCPPQAIGVGHMRLARYRAHARFVSRRSRNTLRGRVPRQSGN